MESKENVLNLQGGELLTVRRQRDRLPTMTI